MNKLLLGEEIITDSVKEYFFYWSNNKDFETGYVYDVIIKSIIPVSKELSNNHYSNSIGDDWSLVQDISRFILKDLYYTTLRK